MSVKYWLPVLVMAAVGGTFGALGVVVPVFVSVGAAIILVAIVAYNAGKSSGQEAGTAQGRVAGQAEGRRQP